MQLKYAANDIGLTEWELQPGWNTPCLILCSFAEQPLRKVAECFIHTSKNGLCCDRIRQLSCCMYSNSSAVGRRKSGVEVFFFFFIKFLFIHTLQFRKQLHAKWNVFSVNAVECYMNNDSKFNGKCCIITVHLLEWETSWTTAEIVLSRRHLTSDTQTRAAVHLYLYVWQRYTFRHFITGLQLLHLWLICRLCSWIISKWFS